MPGAFIHLSVGGLNSKGLMAMLHTFRNGVIVLASLALFHVVQAARADAGSLPKLFDFNQVAVGLESEWLSATTTTPSIVVAEEIRVPGAAWIRLNLDGTVLPGDESAGDGAYLRITSLLDGAVQEMHASHLEQWSYHSAYFNGEAVRVELLASASAGLCRLRVTDSIFQIADELNMPAGGEDGTPRSPCGEFDNRELSDDPRVARVVFASGAIGTVSIIDDPNHTFLTSGPVAAALLSTSVIEFHAPLTLPNGTTLMHPPPSDQYVADLTSIQRVSGAAGSGDNWGYFGALANSTTGLTPFQAEGAFFNRADVVPPVDGRSIRTTGNGFTQPPIFRTWSFVQKTEVGEYVGNTGTRVLFRTDLTSGDAGTLIVDETNGEVIGIASEDGCTLTGGSNAATAITNQNLRNAMNFPLGVCRAIEINLPNGTPELLNPNGGQTVRVDFSGVNGSEPQPGTGLLHYNAGQGWVSTPMTQIVDNSYDAVFPGFPCGTFVDYYFSVETTTGIRIPNQPTNPINTHRSAAASSVQVITSWDFEDATGWFVDNVSVTDGEWERGVPAGNGTRGDPVTDYDGSGQCWLTGNRAGDSDVDGGPTRLRSPTFNLTGTSNAHISYARWFTNTPPDIDRLTVQVSTNGGITYSTFESIPDTAGWVVSRRKISDVVPITASMRFRFSVSDNPNNSRTEAAIDAFSIIDYVCDSVTCSKGDVNNDGLVDGNDVPGFAATLLGASGPGTQPFCATDMDGDGVLELTDDVNSFVGCLVDGVCP